MLPEHDPQALLEEGKRLHKQGKLVEAREIYERVLTAAPGNADALHLLGVMANQQGEYGRAAELINEAIQRNPKAENYHCNLGIALMGLDDLQGAGEQFAAELILNPRHYSALLNLGALRLKQGEMQAAIESFQRALNLQAGDITLLNNLSFAHYKLSQLEEAREIAQKSLALSEANPEAYNLLGLIGRLQGRPEDAVSNFRQVLRDRKDSAELYLNMGLAYRDLGDLDQAMACYAQALELRPGYPSARFCRALVLLARAEFAEGWREYEYGMLCGERQECVSGFPRWQGESLAGRTILLCAEQGLGDEIMFASMLPEIIGAAGHCVVECNPYLLSLYKRSFPTATVITSRLYQPGPEPALSDILGSGSMDVQSPVGSLALYRRRSLADFPAHTGYLVADPARVVHWRERLSALGPGLKVGISWRGGLPQTGASRRSIPLADWRTLFKTAGTQFVSLQYTDCKEEIAALQQAHGIRLSHWQEAIDDYDETAALVCALDLVITVQTAVFHLAGALGRPLWGLLPVPAEWRYLCEGRSMPWYPSARLFRQPAAGNWAAVMDAVAAELRALAA